jgi:hypothetical protein
MINICRYPPPLKILSSRNIGFPPVNWSGSSRRMTMIPVKTDRRNFRCILFFTAVKILRMFWQ